MATNYALVMTDGVMAGEEMARNKHAILTKEEFSTMALNLSLPKDILEDKYRAYRNAYVRTLDAEKMVS